MQRHFFRYISRPWKVLHLATCGRRQQPLLFSSASPVEFTSGGLRLGSLEPLHLGVQGHAAKGEAGPDEVKLGDGGSEENDGGLMTTTRLTQFPMECVTGLTRAKIM